MSIQVVSRSFTMSIIDAAHNSLLIKCNENVMQELRKFVRMDALGFRDVGDVNESISQPHSVITPSGVLECPRGKLGWSLQSGFVHFYPLGGFGELKFSTSLDNLAATIIRETKESRWDDYCVTSTGYNGKMIYIYTHLLFNDWLTLTDRDGFYMTMKYDPTHPDGPWTHGEYYVTKEMWNTIATDDEKTRFGENSVGYCMVLRRHMTNILKRWPAMDDFKKEFNLK